MIEFNELSIRNFLSVGNVPQSLQLNKEHLTLVLGENIDLGGEGSGSRNGVGKSTICNALSYALFGVALNSIKKDNLINKTNGKNMLVSLSFSKNDINYRIERGRKPNVLRFYVNDEIQESKEVDEAQGDMRETQKDLGDLLGMSHDMFKHIVSLNTYTEPFLSMKANDQRAIIEQLLGITLLSEKAEVLKEQIRQTKDVLIQETAEIEAAKKSNEKIQQSIDSLITNQQKWNINHTTQLERIAKEIIELEGLDVEKELSNHAEIKIHDELTATYNSLKKELRTLEAALNQATKNVNKYVKELGSLDSKICHACEQGLHDAKHATLAHIAETSLVDAHKYFEKVSDEIEIINNSISDIGVIHTRPKTYYDSVEEALTHQNNFQTFVSQLETKSIETDPYQSQIDQLRNVAMQEINWDRINEHTSLKDHQDFLLKLLTNKDSFIRKKIIDQNLSYLNNRLSYYIDKMGLPHMVIFQNDLSVEISQYGQDLDFHNLSRGEMTRVILSLSFAFRDVWQSLYQSINLLFIDELADMGIDAAGLENLLAILKKTARETQKSVWLISHREELVARVDNILKVAKQNGFTTFLPGD